MPVVAEEPEESHEDDMSIGFEHNELRVRTLENVKSPETSSSLGKNDLSPHSGDSFK